MTFPRRRGKVKALCAPPARRREKGMEKGNPRALLPIGVFLLLYLGLGLTFEYVLAIPMGFSEIPIVIAFLAAILVAVAVYGALVVALRCLSREDLSLMPKGDKIARLLRL